MISSMIECTPQSCILGMYYRVACDIMYMYVRFLIVNCSKPIFGVPCTVTESEIKHHVYTSHDRS